MRAAQAVEPVSVSKELKAIDISNTGDWYRGVDGGLKVSTAPDRDGIVRRVEIRPKNSTGNANWYVFALANDTSEQIDRLIVAPHYRMVNAGVIWPDLDSIRIEAITPSEGFSLEAQEDRESDVFLITLNPGAVITLIAELKTNKLPRLVLWEPSAYKDTINSLTLYRGIVLGISGLLAVFLTILFVVKGTAIFPATAALAWSVLAYVCVDFGFWDKVVSISQTSEPIWRSGTEVLLAISLLLFVYAYLRLNRWNRNYTFIVVGWLLSLAILLGVVLFDPAVAAGLARLSFAATVAAASFVIIHLALKRDDRAIMLIPIWLLTIAWLFGCWLTVTGRLSNDIIQPALGGGLVLIVLLIAFTILQNAFSGGALAQGLVSDAERQALALAGSGDVLWDWETGRDAIFTGPGLAETLGISPKQINGPLQKMRNLIHPNDRERFQSTLESILEHKRGRISQSFRICGDDGHYHWFRLKARPMIGADGGVMRCIGTLTDITDSKNAEIRLLQDAVRDNLTGLENRELFENRLDMAMKLAGRGLAVRPSVFYINIDEFRAYNSRVGFAVGDTILLTVARRVSRLLGEGDAIARLGGDQFAIMLLSENEPDRIASFADTIRTTLRAPIDFADQKIKLTASIGIATWTKDQTRPDLLIRDAELATLHAKRLGGDRIEPFRPAFRTGKDDTTILVDDLKIALERGLIKVVYQPIVSLRDSSTIGFEALVRWEHNKLGMISPADFVPIAESSGLIDQLGVYVLTRAIRDFNEIHALHPDVKPFVSVNVSSRQLLQDDFVKDIEKILETERFEPANLKLEITESMVMENPEYSSQVLSRIRNLGVGLSLDDFGTGYSSLAYLMRFPFDTIKIDSSFIQARDRKERLIVLRSIIAMAHGLEQNIIAEGVERDSDVTELKQLGCESAQGFYFGEPMDAQSISSLIESETRLAGQ
ncbi:MAG: sensor domain-containing phosphodiesterase [Salaquimonas sp.]